MNKEMQGEGTQGQSPSQFKPLGGGDGGAKTVMDGTVKTKDNDYEAGDNGGDNERNKEDEKRTHGEKSVVKESTETDGGSLASLGTCTLIMRIWSNKRQVYIAQLKRSELTRKIYSQTHTPANSPNSLLSKHHS